MGSFRSGQDWEFVGFLDGRFLVCLNIVFFDTKRWQWNEENSDKTQRILGYPSLKQSHISMMLEKKNFAFHSNTTTINHMDNYTH
jgi:hypothetical protein